MKTIIQENIVIRVIKISLSFVFLFFLFIGRKSNESTIFIIVFSCIFIILFLLCFVSAFAKIEITDQRVVKTFIIPVKKIDRKSVINMELRKKKDDTYDVLFLMKNEKISVLHIGPFFPVYEVIKYLNNENKTAIYENDRKEKEKIQTVILAKIVLGLTISIVITLILLFLIACLLRTDNVYIKKIILLICACIFLPGFFAFILKKTL